MSPFVISHHARKRLKERFPGVDPKSLHLSARKVTKAFRRKYLKKCAGSLKPNNANKDLLMTKDLMVLIVDNNVLVTVFKAKELSVT